MGTVAQTNTKGLGDERVLRGSPTRNARNRKRGRSPVWTQSNSTSLPSPALSWFAEATQSLAAAP
jgi:hypothetical protein